MRRRLHLATAVVALAFAVVPGAFGCDIAGMAAGCCPLGDFGGAELRAGGAVSMDCCSATPARPEAEADGRPDGGSRLPAADRAPAAAGEPGVETARGAQDADEPAPDRGERFTLHCAFLI